MHTGIEEAVNLAWKLEAVLKGWGGRKLLASYESERKPVAQRNIDLSTKTYRALRSIPPFPAALTENAWRTTQLGTYSIPDHVRSCPTLVGSPITIDDGSPALDPAPTVPTPSSRPGARAPHAWVSENRSTLDLFGAGFVLLKLGQTHPDTSRLSSAAAARGVPLAEVSITDETTARLYEKPLVLVRPDFHIAWRGEAVPQDALALVDTIRGA